MTTSPTLGELLAAVKSPETLDTGTLEACLVIVNHLAHIASRRKLREELIKRADRELFQKYGGIHYPYRPIGWLERQGADPAALREAAECRWNKHDFPGQSEIWQPTTWRALKLGKSARERMKL